MTKMGRPPKPTAMKLLTGNPGRRPIAKGEVQPSADAPTCPEWLGEVGRAYWDDVMASMPAGFITRVDGQILSLYCHAWEVFHEARAVVKEEGATCQSEKGGAYQHPEVGRMNKAFEQACKLAAKYGFTPSDRVGLLFGDKGDEEDDPLVAMMRERAGRN